MHPAGCRWLSLLALLLGTGTVLAAEGRHPLWTAATIASSGHYVVTRDIDAPGNVLTINAPRVTLDLNGFTVSGSSSTGPVIVIGAAATDVVIRNGRLQDGTSCVDATAAVSLRIRIEDVECDGPNAAAIYLPSVETHQIRRVRVTRGLGAGIVATGGRGGIVEACTIEDIEGHGIDLDDAESTIVRGNAVSRISHTVGREYSGISIRNLTGGDNRIEDNVLSDMGVGDGFGIHVQSATGNIIRNNTVSNATDGGIYLSGNASQIVGNAVHSSGMNPANGITVSGTGVRVAENVLSTSYSYGISVSGSHHVVEWNKVNNGGACGINFNSATSHVYRYNMLKGSSPGVCNATGATDGGGNVL